jgi:2,4-dienoyl-CoA reductase-like NADH-dependent reductase (Old Yellow Enzyme family)
MKLAKRSSLSDSNALQLINKKSDMVAMGRAHIADPALVRKTKARDMSSIVECNHCNKCLYFMHGEQSMSCTMNRNL